MSARFFFWFFVAASVLNVHAAQPVRIVATGGRIGSTFYTPPAGSTAFWHRTPHKLGGPVAELQIGFMDWIHSTTDEAPNTVNEVTLSKVWIERASTGQVLPVTFAGQRQLVLPLSGTAPYLLSDAIASTSWSGVPPVRDEVFWVHSKGTIPTGGKIPVGTPSTYTGARFIVYDPVNDPGTSDFAGAVPTITGATARVIGLPLAFLGRYTGPGYLAVAGIGDSILDGSGDAANPVQVISGYGFFNRAAVDTGGANAHGMFNLTRHGETAATWVSKHQRQIQFLRFANVVVEEFGTNDLGTNGTGVPATILGRLETIWTLARGEGVQKILRTNLLPRTSSDPYGWATFEAQTPNTGWGTAGKRDEINTGLAAAHAAGKFDVFVDVLSTVRHPSDDHYWAVNGTNSYTTGDGTHPSARGYQFMAVPLRAALEAVSVDDYDAWSDAVAWNGADSSVNADANGDGVNNLLAYALAVSPVSAAAPGNLPAAALDLVRPDGPWLEFTYRENTRAADLTYEVQSSTTLASWTTLEIDGVNVIEEIADPDPDGDGQAVLKRVLKKISPSDPRQYLRLRVTH